MGVTVSRTHGFEVEKYLDTIHYSLKIIYDYKNTVTEKYKEAMNVFRRGTSFTLNFKNKKSEIYHKLGLKILTSSGPVTRGDEISIEQIEPSYFKIYKEDININEYLFTVNIDTTASVGWYKLFVVNGEEKITGFLHFIIIFNPFHPSDEVYTQSKDLIDNYLLDSTTAICYGSEDNYITKKFNLDQFSIECLLTLAQCLFRMNILDRQNPVQVSRAIADFVNNNNENGLMSKKICGITEGRHPTIWTNMIDIYQEYLNMNMEPVKWGNFFIFAVLITSLSRCVGIVCRTVTGFSLGYNDQNQGLSKIELSASDLIIIRNSDSLLNIHCWNNVIIKSSVLAMNHLKEIKDDCWHHLDGTRENPNIGFFKYGPYPLFLLKNGVSKTETIDGRLIYSSLNTQTKYLIKNDHGNVINEYYKKTGGKSLYTSKGNKNVIEITNEYIKLINNKNNNDKNPLRLELKIDKNIELGNPLKYCIKVKNSSENSKTVICVSLQFRSLHIDNYVEERSKSYEFYSKNAELKGVFDLIPTIEKIDISQMCYFWEIRFFDEKMNKLKFIRKTTAVKPLLVGEIISLKTKYGMFTLDFMGTVKNISKINLKDIKFVIFLESDLNIRKEAVFDLDPKDKKGFLISIDRIPRGIATFVGVVSYGLSIYKFGQVSQLIS